MAKIDELCIENHPSILRASHVVWRHGNKPVRVVLRHGAGDTIYPFIVHDELLDFDTEKGGFTHHSWYRGEYFHPCDYSNDADKGYSAANARYNERVEKL